MHNSGIGLFARAQVSHDSGIGLVARAGVALGRARERAGGTGDSGAWERARESAGGTGDSGAWGEYNKKLLCDMGKSG